MRARLAQVNPAFAAGFARPVGADPTGPAGDAGGVSDAAFTLAVTNYWQAEAIGRASPTMSECAQSYLGGVSALAAE